MCSLDSSLPALVVADPRAVRLESFLRTLAFPRVGRIVGELLAGSSRDVFAFAGFLVAEAGAIRGDLGTLLAPSSPGVEPQFGDSLAGLLFCCLSLDNLEGIGAVVTRGGKIAPLCGSQAPGQFSRSGRSVGFDV